MNLNFYHLLIEELETYFTVAKRRAPKKSHYHCKMSNIAQNMNCYVHFFT